MTRLNQDAEQAIRNYVENAKNMLTTFKARPEYLRMLTFDLEHYLRFFSTKDAERRGSSTVEKVNVDNAIKHFGKPEEFIKSEFRDAATLSRAQSGILELFESMKKKIEGQVRPTVLDAGCGWGRWIVKLHRYCSKNFEMTGVDRDRFPLRYALSLDKLLNVARSDVECLPFRDGLFDLIFCSGVIHEIKTYEGREKTIAEFRRTLKNEGTLYIMDAFSTNLVFSVTTRLLQHVTSKAEWWFKQAQLGRILEVNGFKTVDVQKMRYRLFGAIEISMIASVKE